MIKVAKYLQASEVFKTIDKIMDKAQAIEWLTIRKLIDSYNKAPTKLQKAKYKNRLKDYEKDIAYLYKFRNHNLKLSPGIKNTINDFHAIFA